MVEECGALRPLEPLPVVPLGLARSELDAQAHVLALARGDRRRAPRDAGRARHLDPPPAHRPALRRPGPPPAPRAADARHAARGRPRDRANVSAWRGTRP